MSRFGKYQIDGVEYDLDDLKLNEMKEIEDLCDGVAFSEINYGSSNAMIAISYVLQRREKPDITLHEAGEVKIVDFLPADEELPALPPEVGDEEIPSESYHEGSGVPHSVVSITG